MVQHVKVPAGGRKITVNRDFSLNVPDNPIIPYIEGDGTGLDITPVMIEVVDAALAAVGLGHRRVHHLDHHRRNIQAGTVALDVGNDRVVRNVEAEILIDRDLLATGRDIDVLNHGFS